MGGGAAGVGGPGAVPGKEHGYSLVHEKAKAHALRKGKPMPKPPMMAPKPEEDCAEEGY